MKCKDFQDHLLDYTEGNLPEDMLRTMEAHTGSCSSCAVLLDKFREVAGSIALEKQTLPDPFTATRIVQRLENAAAGPVKRNFPALRPILVTFGLLAALAAGFLVGNAGASRKTDTGVENTQLQMLKTNFFVQDFVDEDITLLTDN